MVHKTTALEDIYDFIIDPDRFDQETPQIQSIKNEIERLFQKEMETHKYMRRVRLFFGRIFRTHPFSHKNKKNRKPH